MRRRDLIQSLGYATLLSSRLWPKLIDAPPLPPATLFDSDPETYWGRIRDEEFLLPTERVFLNTGTLGVAPKPVLAATIDYLLKSAELNLDELPRWGGEPMEDLRSALARLVGGDKDEIALTHNTTEGMNMVANGLDLRPGDEVLLTDQEHPGGTECWNQKQARFGIQVRFIKIPILPKRPEDIADVLISAISPRTRVISFSGFTTTTGLRPPIRMICDAARAKGVISVIDGAHMPGQAPLNLHELGCDYLAASPHKWMLTPCGCGFLYGRGDMLDRLWANVATFNWNDRRLKAARLMMVGSNNAAVFKGYLAALKFYEQIGPDRIYTRIHELARQVYSRAVKLKNARMLTPEDDRFYAGMVTFGIEGADLRRLDSAFKKRLIWIVPGSDRVRVSTHIHTRPADLEVFFDTLEKGLAA